MPFQKRPAGTVALKTVFVPNDRQLLSIQREIQALARIRHPGVVKIFDKGIDHGKPWYAMELLTGDTLDEYLRKYIWKDNPHNREWTTAAVLDTAGQDMSRSGNAVGHTTAGHNDGCRTA